MGVQKSGWFLPGHSRTLQLYKGEPQNLVTKFLGGRHPMEVACREWRTLDVARGWWGPAGEPLGMFVVHQLGRKWFPLSALWLESSRQVNSPICSNPSLPSLCFSFDYSVPAFCFHSAQRGHFNFTWKSRLMCGARDLPSIAGILSSAFWLPVCIWKLEY